MSFRTFDYRFSFPNLTFGDMTLGGSLYLKPGTSHPFRIDSSATVTQEALSNFPPVIISLSLYLYLPGPGM